MPGLCAVAQTRFEITHNQGFGSKPTFTELLPQAIYTLAEAKNVFLFLKDSAAIEWRYSYAGCEKRAHAASLLLKGKGVAHYKIWNFDPSYISLFNKKQAPWVYSRAGLSNTISWGYHVAITLFVLDSNKVKPVVLDPALSDNILSAQAWLDLQHTPNSYYTFLDARWYNYATTDKFKYKCDSTVYLPPPCMDALFTGDFFLNDGISLTNQWVEEALAVNEVAMKIINSGLIKGDNTNSPRRKAFTELVENFDSLTNALKGSDYPDIMRTYISLLIPFQNQFNDTKIKWKVMLDRLRN